MKTPELILMVDAPETLAARLGHGGHADRAGAVAELLLRATVELATSYWPGDVSLHAVAGHRQPLFRDLAAEFHLQLVEQAGDDPARVMQAALDAGIARCGAAAALGDAVPHLPGLVLEDAFEHLARGRSVLGPTDSGGFYLIGLQVPRPGLLQGIAWSGAPALTDTLARARAVGLEFELLPTERAIAGWGDLFLASRRLAALQPYV
jgi:hypothetical protein